MNYKFLEFISHWIFIICFLAFLNFSGFLALGPIFLTSGGQTFWGNTDGSSNNANAGGHSSSQANDALGSGAELNADMRQWATGEMQKIKGNSDLTLVSFCMTLSSNSEIREYMRDVLGSTPQVSSFASEFIRRKNKIGGKKKRGKKR